MIVNSIYINTYRKDFPFARICIASIRYWYPDIPIYLIKDMGSGDFSTSEVEKYYNVRVLDTGKKKFGWGFGKIEPLFFESKENFLFLDADTIMTGPVIDQVKFVEADFIVDDEDLPLEKIKRFYYNPDKINNLFPSFHFPGYAFNTGQWFGTSGILKRTDFEDCISWNPNPSLKFPDIFHQADQGVFNFIVHRLEGEKRIKVVRIPLMIWPDNGAADHIDLNAIRTKEASLPRIIHWAGTKRDRMDLLPRIDLLHFFQDMYYQRVGKKYRYKDKITLFKYSISDLAKRISGKISKSKPDV